MTNKAKIPMGKDYMKRVRTAQENVILYKTKLAKFSKVSKLDGIPSWSLQAWTDCKGKAVGGEISQVCQSCYALEGNYVMNGVIAPRAYNGKAWKETDFVPQMIREIDKTGNKFFRLFDSGDFTSVDLAEKWIEIMKALPDVKFWVPTRIHKLERFHDVLARMESLPNVVVRRSADSITGDFEHGVHGSTVIKYADDAPKGVKVCGAYQNSGTCNGCRSCWSKDVAVIAYPSHGKRIKTGYKRIAIQAV